MMAVRKTTPMVRIPRDVPGVALPRDHRVVYEERLAVAVAVRKDRKVEVADPAERGRWVISPEARPEVPKMAVHPPMVEILVVTTFALCSLC